MSNYQKIINKYEEKLKVAQEKLDKSKDLSSLDLSKYEAYSIGYYRGMIRIYEDIIFDLKEYDFVQDIEKRIKKLKDNLDNIKK